MYMKYTVLTSLECCNGRIRRIKLATCVHQKPDENEKDFISKKEDRFIYVQYFVTDKIETLKNTVLTSTRFFNYCM